MMVIEHEVLLCFCTQLATEAEGYLSGNRIVTTACVLSKYVRECTIEENFKNTLSSDIGTDNWYHVK